MNTSLCWMVFAMLFGFAPPLEAQETDVPTYGGRTAESWASELTRGHQSLHQWLDQPKDSFEAFREIGAAAVPVLVKKLEDKDRMVRHNAAEALKCLGIEARDALPALMRALDDDDAEVRGLACDALGAMGIEAYPAISRLQKLLPDKRHTIYPPHAVWYLRDRARDALVAIHADTLPGFIKGSKSSSIEARMTCIPAVGDFPEASESVVPLLVKLLEDPEPLVRSLAATSLRKLGKSARSATGPLAKHLDDAGEHGIGFTYAGSVEYAAALALRQVGPTEKEVPALVRRMRLVAKSDDKPNAFVPSQESDRNYVRYICATMIGRIGPEARQAIPDLKVALKDDLLRTAAAASILLINPNDLDARKIFFEAAREGHDWLVIVDAIRRLGWRDDETVKVLQEMLKQDKDRLRIVAGGLLLRIDPEMKQAQQAFREGFGDTFDGMRASYEDMNDDWSGALGILREVPVTMRLALPIAVEKLSDEYRREGAREALNAMSVHRTFAISQLQDQLNASRLELRLNAIEALSLLRPETTEVVSLLIATLDDPAPALRAEAAKALGNIRKTDGPIIEALTKRLKDKYATVRLNAANALAQLGAAAKSAKPGLTALYHDESKPVRDTAVRAVAAIEK